MGFSSAEVTELKEFLHEVKRLMEVIPLSERRRFVAALRGSDQY